MGGLLRVGEHGRKGGTAAPEPGLDGAGGEPELVSDRLHGQVADVVQHHDGALRFGQSRECRCDVDVVSRGGRDPRVGRVGPVGVIGLAGETA